MRPTLVAAALPLLLIASVALVGPSAGLPARASSGRPRARADDLIAGTDFLSVFIGSALPRTPQQVAKTSRAREKVSTTAPEDIGFGARLAPKSSTTTTTTTTVTSTGATPTPFSATTETPLPGQSTHYGSTYSKSLADSETFRPSTEPTQRIEDSASELHYRTYPPENTNTAGDVTLPPDSSISVVTDIVTSKQELISLTAGDPTDGDQRASDGVLSASRITSFYVHHQDDSARSAQHHNTDYHNSHQTSTNGGYQSSSPHSSVPDHTVHYQASTGQSAETGSLFHSSVSPSPSYHTVTLHDQRQDHSYQGHSTVFPQSSSNSWFSSHPTQATQIVVNHPGQPTPRPETSTVQQVISVRVSSSVVQGPSSPPNTARSKTFTISRPSEPPFHHNSESSRHNSVLPGQTEGDRARQYSLPDTVQASQERAVEDQQQVVPTSLVTEDQPAATAVQRSQFSVEESSPSDISALHIQRDHHHQSQQSYRDDGSDQAIATVVEVPAPSVVKYESRVSSPTSNSRIQFYSGPPPSQPEPVRRHGWTPQRGRKSFGHQGIQQQHQQQEQQHQHQVQQSQQPQQQQQQQDQQQPARHQQSHSEPAEHNYEQPEQNYEVDEQVSVVTNGRAHGIQSQDVSHTTQATPASASAPDSQQVDSAGNKAGYVVEGDGFRKYRVEERTSDGFIVGEYGVVNSEGDPLRAVRYTADGTAPTKLIEEALSHFLSL